MTSYDKQFLRELYLQGLEMEDDSEYAFRRAIKRYMAFEDAYLEQLVKDVNNVYNQNKEEIQ